MPFSFLAPFHLVVSTSHLLRTSSSTSTNQPAAPLEERRTRTGQWWRRREKYHYIAKRYVPYDISCDSFYVNANAAAFYPAL
mmetsp:Transcript_12025/g.15084  ORF Transcript_12025/g.15084 Transcript_12025/m.15084 type:complete len:82 (-) Transcript_12025:1150-1395(-)